MIHFESAYEHIHSCTKIYIMKRIPLLWSFVLLLVFNSYSQKPIITCQDAIFNAFKGNSPNAGCEGKVILQAKATDSFSQFCTDSLLRWVVLIDLWGNGSLDLEYNSSLPETDSLLGNDTNGNGINDRYLPKTKSGETIFLPEFNLDAELSTHKITWKTSNSCGQVNSCSSNFIVFDNTAPIAIGPPIDSIAYKAVNYTTEIWANSFDRGSKDDCTPQGNLLFTFNNEKPVWPLINQEHYFKGNGILATAVEYNSWKAQRWVPSKRSSVINPSCEMIHCNDPYIHIINVFDQNGNENSFETKIDYFDNFGFCEPDFLYIKLNSITNNDLKLGYLKFKFGSKNFEIVPLNFLNINYKIINYDDCLDSFCLTLKYRDESIRGINFKDFILFRDHLLGLKKITNTHQLVAADVNADGIINNDDFLLLRKIYFGLAKYDKEKSWFFIRDDQNIQIENGVLNYHLPNPCLKNFSISELKYTAIKRGDIDGSYSE